MTNPATINRVIEEKVMQFRLLTPEGPDFEYGDDDGVEWCLAVPFNPCFIRDHADMAMRALPEDKRVPFTQALLQIVMDDAPPDTPLSGIELAIFATSVQISRALYEVCKDE